MSLAKRFTGSILSSASDAITFLISCSSSEISLSKSLIKTVSSDCKSSAMLFARHSCHQSTCVESTAGSDVTASIEKSIEKLDKCTDVKVEKCMK